MGSRAVPVYCTVPPLFLPSSTICSPPRSPPRHPLRCGPPSPEGEGEGEGGLGGWMRGAACHAQPVVSSRSCTLPHAHERCRIPCTGTRHRLFRQPSSRPGLPRPPRWRPWRQKSPSLLVNTRTNPQPAPSLAVPPCCTTLLLAPMYVHAHSTMCVHTLPQCPQGRAQGTVVQPKPKKTKKNKHSLSTVNVMSAPWGRTEGIPPQRSKIVVQS